MQLCIEVSNSSCVLSDGTDIVNGTPKRHSLHPNVTEVGSERPINSAGSQQHGHQSQSLQLFGPNVQPRHCVIAHTEGIVTVTPCSGNAETYVNGQRIYETTILQVTRIAEASVELVMSLTH
jgi:afadin